MFGRKKPSPDRTRAPLPRGRTADEEGTASNPLARRFRAEGEPRTVDLANPARFHAPAETDEGPAPGLQAAADRLAPVITRDPETGKFYLHPGTVDCPASIGELTVEAPTELRPGDVIHLGAASFRFEPPG